eukprot:2717559-Amphidinium_carterae.1
MVCLHQAHKWFSSFATGLLKWISSIVNSHDFSHMNFGGAKSSHFVARTTHLARGADYPPSQSPKPTPNSLLSTKQWNLTRLGVLAHPACGGLMEGY